MCAWWQQASFSGVLLVGQISPCSSGSFIDTVWDSDSYLLPNCAPLWCLSFVVVILFYLRMPQKHHTSSCFPVGELRHRRAVKNFHWDFFFWTWKLMRLIIYLFTALISLADFHGFCYICIYKSGPGYLKLWNNLPWKSEVLVCLKVSWQMTSGSYALGSSSL